MRARHRTLEQYIERSMRSTIESWSLLTPNDRVMVAISGGKDSYTLLHLLHRIRHALDFPIQLIAVHLDQGQPGYNGAPLAAWLDARQIPHEIVREDTYSEVIERTEPGQTYCTVCSRLRRGILYSVAERLGCGVIALGHHRDDALQTFLMNLFYSGKLQAMPARYQSDDGRFRVIRPLIECDEDRIAEYAELEGFPILPCNLCGSQDGLSRQRMERLMRSLEVEHPHVRSVMANALANVRPTHLLDRELLEIWEKQPVRRGPAPIHAPMRYQGKVVKRLPLL